MPPNFSNLSPRKLRQLQRRGWTEALVQEAFTSGQRFPAVNVANGEPATRYVSPTTGQSVVIKNASGTIIHFGGPGFQYGPSSGDPP